MSDLFARGMASAYAAGRKQIRRLNAAARAATPLPPVAGSSSGQPISGTRNEARGSELPPPAVPFPRKI